LLPDQHTAEVIERTFPFEKVLNQQQFVWLMKKIAGLQDPDTQSHMSSIHNQMYSDFESGAEQIKQLQL
jgi:hypothetical protein